MIRLNLKEHITDEDILDQTLNYLDLYVVGGGHPPKHNL